MNKIYVNILKKEEEEGKEKRSGRDRNFIDLTKLKLVKDGIR